MSETEKNFNQYKGPKIEEIESALNQLDEHNTKHTGLGGALKRVLESVFEHDQQKDISEDNSDELLEYSINTGIEEDDGTGELSEEITRYNISPILKKIGLDLYDAEKLSATNSSGNGGLPAKQGLYIDEIEPFVDFINSNQDAIAESASVSKMIKDIYGSMLKDIERTKGDYRVGIVKDLADIQQSIKSIHFKDSVPNLELGEAYINWGVKPEFDDYLLSRKLGLTNGEGFDAHNWHTDCPEGELEEKWGSLLEHYKKVSRTNGDDNELTILMKMELKEALENLNKWVDNPPESYKDQEAYMKNIQESLKKVNSLAKEARI